MKQVIRKVANLAGFEIRRIPPGPLLWQYYFDFPINSRPRWGHGCPAHPEIARMLKSGIGGYTALLGSFQNFKSYFATIPRDSRTAMGPAWNNRWFSTLDAAALSVNIISRTPKRYIEIGSGTSTKFARHAIEAAGIDTKIISIDPNPRTGVDQICDRVIRQGLETVEPDLFEALESNDILFFDGSHRTFTNSDVTAFFFDILPRLKPGVLVHVHDIFWPDDYPPEWSNRLYSEQYLLGAMMLGGGVNFRVLLPNYFVSRHSATAPLVASLGIPIIYKSSGLPGASFWVETTCSPGRKIAIE